MFVRALIVIFVPVTLLLPSALKADEKGDDKKAGPSIEDYMKDLTDVERMYVRHYIKHRGSTSQLFADQRTGMKTGMVGELVRTIFFEQLAGNKNIYTDHQVNQVINENQMLISNYDLWIVGVSSKDVVDDEFIDLKGVPFVVMGTVTYSTAIGTRTVMRLVAVDKKKLDAKAEEIRGELSFREWTSASGSYTVVAKFDLFRAGRVQLTRKDTRQTIQVKMTELSKQDQDWIRKELEERKKASEREKEQRKRAKKRR